MMMQTAYLLDPETALFRPVTVDNGIGYGPFYNLIDCRTIEVVRFDERHILLTDEDGLRDGLTAFTTYNRYPQPLAGRLVLIGGDGSGPHTSPLISIEDAAKHFTFCRPVLDPVFTDADEVSRDGGAVILAGVLNGFRVRIERRAPVIAEGEA